jgi:hypothetical protein
VLRRRTADPGCLQEELKARFAFFETKIDDAKKEVLLAVAESTARLDEV